MALPTTSNVTRPRVFGYELRIDEGYYRLAVGPDSPLDIVTTPLQAPAISTAQSPEEISNEFGQIFSRVDFTGGEGLDFAHKRNQTNLDSSRFFDSKHIEVQNPAPGEVSKITLLPPTANIETSTDTNLHLVWDGTTLIMGEGTAYRKSTDPTAATPTFDALDPHDGDGAVAVAGACNLGTDVYFALGANGIHKRTAGGTVSSISTTATTRVWGVKRRLLASTSDGTKLDSVATSTGTHTTVATLLTGQVWNEVRDAGKAILATATDGSIYAFGFPDGATIEGAALELKAQSQVGQGEVPYGLEWDGSFVHFTTREVTPSGAIGRWYRAELSDAFEVVNATLLRQWGDQSSTVDHCPRVIRATRDAVFTGVYEDAGAFLWRYDRATTGVTRHLDLGASGLVVDIIVVSGRLFATVSGHGLRREKVGSFETSGYLIGPLADFFTASKKSWAGALIEHDTLPANSRIALYYTTDPAALTDPDSASWQLVKNITSGQDLDETPLGDVDARYLAGMVKLFPDGDATSAPEVRSFSFRAYPGDGDVELTFGVVVGGTQERPGFQRHRARAVRERVYDALKGKEGGYAEIEVLRTGETFRGVVMQVGTRIPAISRTGSSADTATVKFRGRRVVGTDASDSLLGVGLLGMNLLGGLEAA